MTIEIKNELDHSFHLFLSKYGENNLNDRIELLNPGKSTSIPFYYW